MPERDSAQERWTGPRPGPGEAARIAGVEVHHPTRVFERRVEQGSIAGLARDGALYVPLLRRLVTTASGPVRNLGPLQAEIRLVKDDFGLRMLRRAIEITDRSIEEAKARAEPGVWEHELEAAVEHGFRSRGA